MGCSLTPAALGAAPPRWALSPWVLAVRLQRQGPARPAALHACLPPWRSLVARCGPPRASEPAAGVRHAAAGRAGEQGPEDGRGDSPRRTVGQGLIHPREKKTGEGGIKIKPSLASLRAKGRVSVQEGADPLPSWSTRAGVWGPASGLGTGGRPAAAACVLTAQRGLPR